MSRDPAVVLAHTLRPWAQQLHFFVMDHGGAVVRGYAMSLDEAVAEAVDVVIVDDVTSWMSALAMERLHERGIAVVGVYEELEGDPGKWWLLGLGADGVVPASSPPEAFAAEISRARDQRAEPAMPRNPSGEERSAGRLVVVASAGGGSGATEVAIAIAAANRSREGGVLLIDTDDQSPGLAARLRLPLAPNVATALDAHFRRSGTIDSAVHASPSGGIATMPGIAAPDEWEKLRSGDVLELLTELRDRWALVVANAGPRIELLPGHSRARFGLARSIVASADVLVVVAVASPGGVCRLLEWAVHARPLRKSGALHVVLNRNSGGRFAAASLIAELSRAWPLAAASVAPYDPRVPKAEWQGELVQPGPFTRAIDRVAAAAGGR